MNRKLSFVDRHAWDEKILNNQSAAFAEVVVFFEMNGPRPGSNRERAQRQRVSEV